LQSLPARLKDISKEMKMLLSQICEAPSITPLANPDEPNSTLSSLALNPLTGAEVDKFDWKPAFW